MSLVEFSLLTAWRNARFLRTGSLNPSANIWFWSANGKVEVRWDNVGRCFEGVPAWSAQRGAYHMSSAEFVAGVQAFNDEFLAAMARRVEEIRASWHRPDVRVDFEHLLVEQVDRSRWLAQELATGGAENTDSVLAAARALLAALPLPE